MRFRLIESEEIEHLSNEYDSEGNQLTVEQAEFFKNSKVRDESGRLLVCYHATNKPFTTFRTPSYFTDSYLGAVRYGDGKHIFNTYLNIEKPFIFDYNDLDSLDNTYYYNNQEYIEKELGIYDEELWNAIVEIFDGNNISYSYLIEIVQQMNKYDGLILLNSPTTWGLINQYIAFKSNQIKAITNKNPTSSNNINEDLWQHRNGQEIYNPIQDSKYRKLQKKPINTLTVDEIKYLFVVNRAHYGMFTKQHDSYEDAYNAMIDDDPENSYDTDMFNDCYEHFSKLKFPLTIYRAIRSDEIDSDGNIKLGKYSRSWSSSINIYKSANSTFKNSTNIVSARINSDVIDNSETIVNYYYYTASRTVGYNKENNIYGEYEITLKASFKQSDLTDLHLIDKVRD